MATNASDPHPAVADLRVAIRLVSRGLARAVTIAGVADPEAAAAEVAGVANGVSIEIVAPRDAASPASAIRVRRADPVPASALSDVSTGPVGQTVPLLMRRAAR
jgi:hypothetical protein